jgi:hypothetical protein
LDLFQKRSIPYASPKVSHIPPPKTEYRNSRPVQIPFLAIQNIGIFLQLLIEFLLDLFQHVSLNEQMFIIQILHTPLARIPGKSDELGERVRR